jgi:hypothetical protein
MKKPWFKAAGSGDRSSGVHYVMDLALRGKAGDQCGPQQGTEDVISDFDSVASAFQTGRRCRNSLWPALVHGPGVAWPAPGSFMSGGFNSSDNRQSRLRPSSPHLWS